MHFLVIEKVIKKRIKLTVNPNIKIIFAKERNERPEPVIAEFQLQTRVY